MEIFELRYWKFKRFLHSASDEKPEDLVEMTITAPLFLQKPVDALKTQII
jgi:hypothetical protein